MIRTRALGFAHPGGPHLRFSDVDVAAGGTLVLRGPSGSGKSTWLALAAGLLTPGEGSIEVANQSVGALKGPARDAWRGATVGVLPQRLHLSADLSVADNLALVYRAAGLPVDGRAIDELLAALGIAALRERRPSALSGGQAQRVALARALLRRPALLLADEPTASLDDAACAQALDLLRETAQRVGATLVIATHDARALAAFHGAAVLSLEPAELVP